MTTCLVCPSWAPCKCDGQGVTYGSLPLAPPKPRSALEARAAQVRQPIPSRVQGMKGARAKGAVGERDVINVLIPIVHRAMRKFGFTEEQVAKADRCIQRNQNQSAVGGNDLSHTFGLSFEVKRQEALSVNTWWKQCEAAAKPNNELPVLVYRQNGRPWHVITYGFLWLPGNEGSSYGNMKARLEMDWETFQTWFEAWVLRKLQNGELPRGVDI